jgi:hypothetical protein
LKVVSMTPFVSEPGYIMVALRVIHPRND